MDETILYRTCIKERTWGHPDVWKKHLASRIVLGQSVIADDRAIDLTAHSVSSRVPLRIALRNWSPTSREELPFSAV
ncbi:hypothetical protein KPH14_012460 [Odynerus spinipes]|uniref:Uncharacterized protein n=1 Tax=Odynerus spinipes TaxID=1348599 RepID=A0AAD9RIA9_9HYME|nr:hypothetical protein KPH14_012460 [Odynerus spinipes]